MYHWICPKLMKHTCMQSRISLACRYFYLHGVCILRTRLFPVPPWSLPWLPTFGLVDVSSFPYALTFVGYSAMFTFSICFMYFLLVIKFHRVSEKSHSPSTFEITTPTHNSSSRMHVSRATTCNFTFQWVGQSCWYKRIEAFWSNSQSFGQFSFQQSSGYHAHGSWMLRRLLIQP